MSIDFEIPPDAKAMRERVRQLGGRFEIESSGRGTTVRAIVPLEAGTDEDHTNPDSR